MHDPNQGLNSYTTEIVFIPVIDACGGMAGEPLAVIQEWMTAMIEYMAQRNQQSVHYDFCVAPLVFSDTARWVGLCDGQPVPADEFDYPTIHASGTSQIANAFELLNQKLISREKGGWMNRNRPCAPIIFLFSGSESFDNWPPALERLKARGWFRAATKIAVAMKPDTPQDMLTMFTTSKETVLDRGAIGDDSVLEILMAMLKITMRVDDDDDPYQTGYVRGVNADNTPDVPDVGSLIMDDTDELF